jgi:hypothetical protein
MPLSSFIDFNSKEAKERDKKIHLSAYQRWYYEELRDWILEKKKEYNKLPYVKEREKLYHHNYYLLNKESVQLKNKQRYRNRQNNNKNNK